MTCQTLFSGKNMKYIINLPSAEYAQKMVKVNKGSDKGGGGGGGLGHNICFHAEISKILLIWLLLSRIM